MSLIKKIIYVMFLIHLHEGTKQRNDSVRILDPYGKAEDAFGSAVAISKDYIIISSRHDNNEGQVYAGSVSIYANDKKISHLRKIAAIDGKDFDYFGTSVAIHKEFILVGSSKHDVPNNNEGSVYIYAINKRWMRYQKIVASDLSEKSVWGEQFGSSLDISENKEIVIGAPMAANKKGFFSGVAFVFIYDGLKWVQKQKLSPSNSMGRDKVGYSVSITKDYIALGAPDDDSSDGWFSGAVYTYRKDRNGFWKEDTKLFSPKAYSMFGSFGKSLGISGNRLVIGAPGEESDKGNAYVYMNNGNTWKLEATLEVSDYPNRLHFGFAVSIYLRKIVIATMTDTAHFFELSSGQWIKKSYLITKHGEEKDQIYSVGMVNGYVILGCRSNVKGEDSGAAYFFHV